MAVRRQVGQKRARTGTTSMGVQYDLGAGVPPMRAKKPRATHGWFIRRRKQVMNAVLTALVIIGSAAFAVLIGDAFWADIPAEATAVPVLVALTLSPETPLVLLSPSAPRASPSAAAKNASIPPPAPDAEEAFVWIPQSGSRYHANAACSNMRNPRRVPLSEAVGLGLTPCRRCDPPT